MKLRPYQIEAVNACAQALRSDSRALIVASTGSGKSIVAASIAQRFTEKNASARVLILCYVQEILQSNHDACLAFGLDSGIYCAGAGKRATTNRVIHASRDSLGSKPLACGSFDMVIIDEVHLLSSDEDSRYQKIIAALKPKYLCGLTATPFRLQGGYIYGKRKLFPRVAYEIGMESLVKQGFLVPFVFPKVPKLVDASGFKLKNGEFDSSIVELAVCDVSIIAQSLKVWHEHAKDRHCSLFFCHSIEHARRCERMFKEMFPGISTGYLDGTTHKGQRSVLIEDMKAGKVKAVFNVGVLTTGTNIPIIDCVVWLRPTMSPVLFVQGSGRASRLHPLKSNALVIDVVGNMDRFGSLYNPIVSSAGKGKKMEFSEADLIAMGIDPRQMKGEAPTKECPACGAVLHAAAKKCDGCGKLFISLKDVFSGEAGENEYTVLRAGITQSLTAAREACVIVTYTTNKGIFKEWIMYEKSWERERYLHRKKMLASGTITHLKVEPNQRNPNFPKLTPLARQSKVSLSDG